jgi:hypothetical protein
MLKSAISIITLTFAMSVSNVAFSKDIIDNKSEFLQKVVGKKVAQSSNTWLRMASNGQIDGRVKGIKVSGMWYWQGNYWCRTARIGIIPVPRECQQITLLGGNKLELQRYKGTGSKHNYTMN